VDACTRSNLTPTPPKPQKARSNLTPTPPKPQKGDFKYFVKWDDEKTGGRYFECNILKNVYGDKYEIKAHDGDRDTFDMDRIFKIGCTPGKGDSVIAYWDDRSYAFLGTADAYVNGEWYIKFADGDKAWIDATKVFKRVPMWYKGCKTEEL